MSDVIKYPLSAAIELCEQLDNYETNYHLKMLEYKRERDEARELLESEKITRNHIIQRGIEMQKKLREWKTLCLWGGTPEHIHGFIGGQQTRIWHLECERDEARAGREAYKQLAIKHAQERDEAREHFEDVKEYGTEEINAAVELRQKLAKAIVERDKAREKAERYRIEANAMMMQRDEAREALASREVVIAQQNVITDLLLERDEAREALMKIEDLFIDGTDIYADREKMGMIAREALDERAQARIETK